MLGLVWFVMVGLFCLVGLVSFGKFSQEVCFVCDNKTISVQLTWDLTELGNKVQEILDKG